jgi:hypothetical protein
LTLFLHFHVNLCCIRGVVWISLSRHSLNWRVVQYFLLAKSEKNWPKNIERVTGRGKTLARLARGFTFLLANPEFYSHLHVWRVGEWLSAPWLHILQVCNIATLLFESQLTCTYLMQILCTVYTIF